MAAPLSPDLGEAVERRFDEGERRLHEWHASEPVRELHAVLAALDGQASLDAAAFAAALAPWIDDSRWYRALLSEALAAMRADPLAALPWRMQPGRMVQGIALAEAGGGSAMLALVSADGVADAGPARERLLFDCGWSLVAMVAGTLKVEHWMLDREAMRISLLAERWLGPGEQVVLDNRREQLLIRSAPRDAVLLTMAVAGPLRNEPTLEFDRSGAMLRQGCADPVVSRMLGLLALVPHGRREERRELLSALSADADPMLRWQAMRHWLVEDAAAALPRLRAMASADGDGAVRRAAMATLALVDRLAREPCDAG